MVSSIGFISKAYHAMSACATIEMIQALLLERTQSHATSDRFCRSSISQNRADAASNRFDAGQVAGARQVLRCEFRHCFALLRSKGHRQSVDSVLGFPIGSSWVAQSRIVPVMKVIVNQTAAKERSILAVISSRDWE